MTPHPATYTDALLPIFAELLLKSHGSSTPDTLGVRGASVAVAPRPAQILDPFAGTGKIARLRAWLPQAEFYGYEIEPEWAEQARAAGCHITIGDCRNMWYADDTFDAICTSPTYGNRMADHHHARDASPRHTYRHTLGRPLHPANSGAMQWGPDYRAFHLEAWHECHRVLKPDGILVLNCKDHVRKGAIQPVTNWHAVTLLSLGFVCTRRVQIPCPGNRHGANGTLRVAYESVLQFRQTHHARKE